MSLKRSFTIGIKSQELVMSRITRLLFCVIFMKKMMTTTAQLGFLCKETTAVADRRVFAANVDILMLLGFEHWALRNLGLKDVLMLPIQICAASMFSKLSELSFYC
nr:hypothetical protein [Tanacetum cinerariifolium]